MLLLSEPFSPSPEPACHCVTEAGLLVLLSAVLSATIAGVYHRTWFSTSFHFG